MRIITELFNNTKLCWESFAKFVSDLCLWSLISDLWSLIWSEFSTRRGERRAGWWLWSLWDPSWPSSLPSCCSLAPAAPPAAPGPPAGSSPPRRCRSSRGSARSSPGAAGWARCKCPGGRDRLWPAVRRELGGGRERDGSSPVQRWNLSVQGTSDFISDLEWTSLALSVRVSPSWYWQCVGSRPLHYIYYRIFPLMRLPGPGNSRDWLLKYKQHHNHNHNHYVNTTGPDGIVTNCREQ